MLTVIVSIIVFGLLIGIHEAGHLVAAKLNGIKVHEFAIGMGPKLVSFSTKETMYALRLIPIGGYCKMEGEDEESTDKRAFCNKSAWRKFTVIVAGAIMNLVLGFVALCILIGSNTQVVSTTVGEVIDGTPAYESGFKANDQILKLNNTKINIHSDVSFFLSQNGENEVNAAILRNGEIINIKITPYEEKGGFYFGYRPKIIQNSVLGTISQAFYTEIFIAKVIFVTFGQLFGGKISMKETSGPVGIVTEIGKAAKQGFLDIVYLIALISINLGLFNLLPFPALDGGRAVFSIWEMVTKKKPSAKVEGVIHGVGFLLLLLLMVFVTFNDVTKLFNR